MYVISEHMKLHEYTFITIIHVCTHNILLHIDLDGFLQPKDEDERKKVIDVV